MASPKEGGAQEGAQEGHRRDVSLEEAFHRAAQLRRKTRSPSSTSNQSQSSPSRSQNDLTASDAPRGTESSARRALDFSSDETKGRDGREKEEEEESKVHGAAALPLDGGEDRKHVERMLAEPLLVASADDLRLWYDATIIDVRTLLAEDRLYMAEDKFNHMLSILSTLHQSSTDDAVRSEASALLDRLNTSDFVANMKERLQQTKLVMELLENEDGWTLVKAGKKVRTWYRKEEDKEAHSFRVVGDIDSPIINVIALLYEVELFHNWVPQLVAAKELANPSRFRKLAHLELAALWPVWNRDYVLDAYGVDMMSDRHKVVVYMESIDTTEECSIPNVQVPEPGKRVVRAQLFGGFLLEPLGRNRTRVSMISNVNPRMSVVPMKVINFIAARIVHYGLVLLDKASKFEADSDYGQRVRENRDVYGELEKRLEEYWKARGDVDEETRRHSASESKSDHEHEA